MPEQVGEAKRYILCREDEMPPNQHVVAVTAVSQEAALELADALLPGSGPIGVGAL